MVRIAPMPRPTRRVLNQAINESTVVEHSLILKLAIVFGSVTRDMLTKVPEA